MNKLKDNQEYEVQLIPLGVDLEGSQTSDDDNWVTGQTTWNIWCVLRTGDEVDEILDIDIPYAFEALAENIYDIVSRRVEIANRLRMTLS